MVPFIGEEVVSCTGARSTELTDKIIIDAIHQLGYQVEERDNFYKQYLCIIFHILDHLESTRFLCLIIYSELVVEFSLQYPSSLFFVLHQFPFLSLNSLSGDAGSKCICWCAYL